MLSLSSIVASTLLPAGPILNETAWQTAALSGMSNAVLLLLWGLRFASLDKSTAESCVALTTMICLFTYGVLLCLPESVTHPLSLALRAASPLTFLIIRAPLHMQERNLRSDIGQSGIAFFGTRAFAGTALGILAFVTLLTPGSPQPANQTLFGLLFTVVGALGTGILTRSSETRGWAMPLVSAAPLVAVCALLLPFCHDAGALYAALEAYAAPIIWLSWTILASVQNSEMKEMFGVSEVTITLFDKGVKNLFWIGGFLAAFAVTGSVGEGLISAHVSAMAFVLIAIWLIIVTTSLVRIASVKERGRAIEAAPSPERQLKDRCAAITHDFDLSQRESEILLLLAQGHTQNFICEHFTLSAGTVKSHVAHIYQKTNVHSREELLRMAANYRADLSIRARYELRS